MSAKKVDERPGLSELASDANFVAGYWRRVRKGGGVPPHAPELGECWHWTGGTMKFGYGVLRKGRRGRTILAHRLAYALGRSIPPAKLCVCHKCDNPICVNPGHLFLGTRRDNNKDRATKGRTSRGFLRRLLADRPELRPRGVCHYAAKLSEEDVRQIRASGESVRSLARRYKMGYTTIYNIVKGRKWRHVV